MIEKKDITHLIGMGLCMQLSALYSLCTALFMRMELPEQRGFTVTFTN